MNNYPTEGQILAREMLGHYGYEHGFYPGGFTAALIRCFEAADSGNTARLAAAFPVMGDVAGIMKHEGADGLYALLEYARQEDV